MKKIIVINEEKINEIKSSCNSLCGCADNVSYTLGDNETAEAIDRIENSILNHFSDKNVIQIDEIMESWLKTLCNDQIKTINEMIRQENLWAMGSRTVDESKTHVENMMRLEKYKQLFQSLIK